MLTLVAEPLRAELRVQPTPPSAAVWINGEPVGRGIWDGRLREGAHRVEIAEEGFLPFRRGLSLGTGERRTLMAELDRDPDSEIWGRTAQSVLGAEIGFAVTPNLGSVCEQGCGPSWGLGGVVTGRWYYELPSDLGFGVEAGYLLLRQSSEREPSLQPVGLEPNVGTMTETLMLSAGLLGASGAIRLGRTLPVTIRLGTGIVAGTIGDLRRGSYSTTTRIDGDGKVIHTATGYDVDVSETSLAVFFYAAPDVRLAFPLGAAAELDIGVRAFALFALNQPQWRNVEPVLTAGDGLADFPRDSLTNRVSLVVSPGVGFRHAF